MISPLLQIDSKPVRKINCYNRLGYRLIFLFGAVRPVERQFKIYIIQLFSLYGH